MEHRFNTCFRQLHLKESEVCQLNHETQRLQKLEMEFKYKPVLTDPIDVKLSNIINSTPLATRYKMNFQRESEGVYRYMRKRVIMQIEGDSIVIRVGGGYLTLDQFVHDYCTGQEETSRAKLASLVTEQQNDTKKFMPLYVTTAQTYSANS